MSRDHLAWGRSVPLCALLTVCGLVSFASAAGIGSRIESFSLPDIHGRDRSLAEFKDNKIVVVTFLGTECPLAKLYAARLQQLSDEYAERGVVFVGVDANPQDSLTDMTNFANQFGLKFPLLKDRDQTVADQFGAVRNPAVYVLDKDRAVRYSGRIDDQYGQGASSGYARTDVKSRDLCNALEELLAGKDITTTITQVTGCVIGRTPKAAAKGDVTYTKHIASIMQDRCVSCHRPGQIGPFALMDYAEVAGWGAMMKEVVSDGRMPPWSANPAYGHFSNDRRLSDAEKQLLFTWVDNGCPEGDPADLPPAHEWPEGWSIGKPDQVVYMSKPYKVIAEGVLPYQNITLDPGWTEDKWIQACEVRPGDRSVVHHVIASAVAPSGGNGGGGGLTNYVPGSVGTIFPPGTATFVRAGTKVRFQMHYTPNGVATDDVSYIGFIFADPTTVKRRVNGGVSGTNAFSIPPNADNHKVVAETTMRTDQLMLWMMPHMHVRGKSMRYEAVFADGTREILLDVPKYDFNWQITYALADPKLLPAGTKVICTAHYDNSENNPANPDPNDTVRWGPQTWHEMMYGWFWTLSPNEESFGPQASAAAENAPSGETQ